MEAAQDKKAKEQLGLSSDSDDSDGSLDDDEVMKIEEGEKRGRKTRAEMRSESRGESSKKKILGKRSRKSDPEDAAMSNSDDEGHIERGIRGSMGKNARSMTPSQRKISVKKILRDRSGSRREGNEPERLDYKLVPEE